jgi:TRAP-type C4-dicarboxylate transport system permease small subunit
VLVLITLVTVGYSVVKRYVLDTPVTWTDELSGYLVVAIVMLGAAEALRRGDHISVDLLTSRMGRRGQRYVALWGLLATAMFAGAVIYSAVLMVRFSFSFGVYSEGYLGVPMWIPQSVLLAGSALLLVVAVVGIVVLFIRR